LVESIRGVEGGYKLARGIDLKEVSLRRVYQAVGGLNELRVFDDGRENTNSNYDATKRFYRGIENLLDSEMVIQETSWHEYPEAFIENGNPDGAVVLGRKLDNE